jgi:hypothetical protein
MFTMYIFKYIFFLNHEVIQLKLLKDLAQISLLPMGIICFADADKRRRKNKCKKTFTCFVLTYVQRVTAAPVTVTYNDRGGKEKKKNHTVDIK